MPHYFFNLHDDRDMPDPTGMELADLAAARRVAIQRVGAILAEADERRTPSTDWRLDITDEHGLVLAWFRVETGTIPALDDLWTVRQRATGVPSGCTAATASAASFIDRAPL